MFIATRAEIVLYYSFNKYPNILHIQVRAPAQPFFIILVLLLK